MEELYYRKYIGDDFNYDAFINKEMNKMPEIKNNNMNFGLIKNIVDKNILDILNTKGL